MADTNASPRPVRLFYSYSHKDEGLREKLEVHLGALKRQGAVTGWHDRKVAAGADWADDIDARLNSADIILLLVSADFIASDYCYSVEVKRAMERHEAGEARVIPVILRPADWKGAPFGKLQALPADGKPVASWADSDAAFLNVVEGIRAVIKELADAPAGAGASAGGPAQGKCFNNLPAPLTPFIGRHKEAAAVEKLLRDDSVRVVVLIGDGGAGKSRLAQHVTAKMAKEFANGVCLVLLERIDDPELVLPAVAQTLRIREVAGIPPRESLKIYLEDKQMLLLLDNFEHVAASAKYVVELLENCPRLKLLLTSRKLLKIRGSRNYSVPPLELPEESAYMQAAALSQYDAVRLFIQSALMVNPEFTVTNENAPAVAEICVRLGGLPLAIELAAARVNRFSPQEILGKLDLNQLVGGAVGYPERQQTMRATIAWSYNLLPEDEKLLFRRASIFRGGCTSEAAEAVCGAGGPKAGVENGLEALVENNLLRRDGAAGGRHRYKMLDMIREYGRELLGEDELALVRKRHADYFVAFAEEGAAAITSAGRGAWLERSDTEHDNLRAVLDRCRGGGLNPETGLRLVGALFWFWNLRAHFSEGRVRVQKALEQSKAAGRTPARARALFCAGGLAFLQGDSKAACLWFRDSLADWRALEETPDRARHLGFTLTIMSQALVDQKEPDEALALARESVDIFRRLGDDWGKALSLNDLGNVLRSRKEYPAALAHYRESLSLWEAMDDAWGLPLTLSNIGFLASLKGEYEESRRHLEAALRIQRRVEDKWGLAETLKCLGDVALHLGEHAEAGAFYRESLTVNRSLGRKQFMVACLEGLAVVAEAAGKAEPAAQLFGAVESLRATVGVPVNLTDRALQKKYKGTLEAAASRFGDAGKFKSAQARGRALGLERAADYALAEVAGD